MERVWNLQNSLNDEKGNSKALLKPLHKTIKKVTEDIEGMKFNTAIASMMSLLNEVDKVGSLSKEDYKTVINLLNPFAPHITEELWEMLGFEGFCSLADWPEYDENLCTDSEVEIAVQVNGKLRGRITVAVDADRETVLAAAKSSEKVAAEISGANIVKEIYIQGKLVNIVIKK